MDNFESGEMYLETVYILSQQMKKVRKTDVSNYMDFAKPSVTRGIAILEKRGLRLGVFNFMRGLVSVDDTGSITLTKEGKALARKVYERHTVLSDLFMRLGVDEKTATEDACRIEHYISDTTFKAIKKHLAEKG